MKKNYYMFKMNTTFLNGFSFALVILVCFIFYLVYGENSFDIFNNNLDWVMILYFPYLVLHELLHSLA